MQAVSQEASDIGEGELDRCRPVAHDRLVAHFCDEAPQLLELPLLSVLDVEELSDHLRKRLAPGRSGPISSEIAGDSLKGPEEICQGSGNADIAAVDAEGSDVARCQADSVVTHSHSH